MATGLLFAKDTARFQAWRDFHASNPEVFRLFVRFAMEAVAAGRQHFGARIIGERIRWYTNVETTGSEFKISDHCWPFYARLAAGLYPELAEVFEFRDARFDATQAEIVRAHQEIDTPCRGALQSGAAGEAT